MSASRSNRHRSGLRRKRWPKALHLLNTRRPWLEELEKRLCLSTISGVVYHDMNGNGVHETTVCGDEPDVVMVVDGPSATLDGFGFLGEAGQFTVDNNDAKPCMNVAVAGSPIAVASADFDGDGRLDLAVVNSVTPANTVSVLMHQGLDVPSFCETVYSVNGSPVSITVGDFNGDNYYDLATANADDANAGSVSILLGDGKGGFTLQANSPSVGVGPSAIVAAHLNATGHGDDLIVTNAGTYSAAGDTVSVLLNNYYGPNNYDGTFISTPYDVGDRPASVAVGDFDGQHGIDFVTTNRGSGSIPASVTVYLNSGYGLGSGNDVFPEAPSCTVNLGSGVVPRSVAVGDFDNDGWDDLAVANMGNDTVKIFLSTGNAGSGLFLTDPSCTVGLGAYADPCSVVAADFDNDTYCDLAMVNKEGSGTVSVLMNDDSNPGHFTLQDPIPRQVGSCPSSLVAGHLNNTGAQDRLDDDYIDLVVTNYGDRNYGGNSASLLLNNGKGTLGDFSCVEEIKGSSD